MAPWPFSTTSSSSTSTTSTPPSSSSSPSQSTHAPTPSTPQPHPSTTASPNLPPASDPLAVTSPPPASLNIRPLFLTLLIACPLLAALPPRKLDLYTFSLAGAWVFSAEELARGQRFGWARLQARAQEAPKAAGERVGYDGVRRGEEGGRVMGAVGGDGGEREDEKGVGEEEEGGEGEGGVLAMAKRLWMGEEREGWKERRVREEREKLAEGKGYRDLIGETVEQAFREGTGRRGDVEEDVEE